VDSPLRLLDDIYEAGAVPELWPKALASLTERIRASGALVLSAQANGDAKWMASPAFAQVAADYFASGLHTGNERTRRLLAKQHSGFITDSDVFQPGEELADPAFQQFWLPRGLGWGAATIIPVPSGETLIFHVERRRVDGPVERELVDLLDGLRPHLARAALFSARLGLEHARSMARAMELVGLPCAVLRGNGKMLAANAQFLAMIPDLVEDRLDRLHIVDAAADRLLADALSGLSLTKEPAHVNSIPLKARSERLPHVLHLLPIRGAANDFFSSATSLLIVNPIDRTAVPTAEVIQGLFDLTPTEARVARGIAQGQRIEELAIKSGVSRETIRNHVKAVLAKTGLSRQQDLVSLLAGVNVGMPE